MNMAFKNKNYLFFSKMPYAFHWLILPNLQGPQKDFFIRNMSPLNQTHFLLVMSTIKSVIQKTFLPKNVNER